MVPTTARSRSRCSRRCSTRGPGAEEDARGVLARYVVLTRHEPGCRNVDLLTSVTHSGRVPRDREVGVGRRSHRRTSTPQLMTDMADARRCRCSRTSPRSTSSTRSRPTTCMIARDARAQTGTATSGGGGRPGSSTCAAVGGAGLLADLADAGPGHRLGVPAALERGVGDVGEAVLEPEVVELRAGAGPAMPEPLGRGPTAYTSQAARSPRVSSRSAGASAKSSERRSLAAQQHEVRSRAGLVGARSARPPVVLEVAARDPELDACRRPRRTCARPAARTAPRRPRASMSTPGGKLDQRGARPR